MEADAERSGLPIPHELAVEGCGDSLPGLGLHVGCLRGGCIVESFEPSVDDGLCQRMVAPAVDGHRRGQQLGLCDAVSGYDVSQPGLAHRQRSRLVERGWPALRPAPRVDRHL